MRWYDARARVSIRRMAAWLAISWDRVATYECLLAEAANQGACWSSPFFDGVTGWWGSCSLQRWQAGM